MAHEGKALHHPSAHLTLPCPVCRKEVGGVVVKPKVGTQEYVFKTHPPEGPACKGSGMPYRRSQSTNAARTA
jgi:hypothetical protein